MMQEVSVIRDVASVQKAGKFTGNSNVPTLGIRVTSTTMTVFKPRPFETFYRVLRAGWEGRGEWSVGPSAVRPLIKLKLRGKDERIARDKTEPMASNLHC